VSSFCDAFDKVDVKTRQAMYKLRLTWPKLFENQVLYAIDVRMRQEDPETPIIAKPFNVQIDPKCPYKNQEEPLPEYRFLYGDSKVGVQLSIFERKRRELASIEKWLQQLPETLELKRQRALGNDLLQHAYRREKSIQMQKESRMQKKVKLLQRQLGGYKTITKIEVIAKVEATPNACSVTTTSSSRDPRIRKHILEVEDIAEEDMLSSLSTSSSNSSSDETSPIVSHTDSDRSGLCLNTVIATNSGLSIRQAITVKRETVVIQSSFEGQGDEVQKVAAQGHGQGQKQSGEPRHKRMLSGTTECIGNDLSTKKIKQEGSGYEEEWLLQPPQESPSMQFQSNRPARALLPTPPGLALLPTPPSPSRTYSILGHNSSSVRHEHHIPVPDLLHQRPPHKPISYPPPTIYPGSLAWSSNQAVSGPAQIGLFTPSSVCAPVLLRPPHILLSCPPPKNYPSTLAWCTNQAASGSLKTNLLTPSSVCATALLPPPHMLLSCPPPKVYPSALSWCTNQLASGPLKTNFLTPSSVCAQALLPPPHMLLSCPPPKIFPSTSFWSSNQAVQGPPITGLLTHHPIPADCVTNLTPTPFMLMSYPPPPIMYQPPPSPMPTYITNHQTPSVSVPFQLPPRPTHMPMSYPPPKIDPDASECSTSWGASSFLPTLSLAASASVDVSKLLSQLLAAGVIHINKDTVPATNGIGFTPKLEATSVKDESQPASTSDNDSKIVKKYTPHSKGTIMEPVPDLTDFDLASLSIKYTSVVASLHQGFPCTSCGMRFKAEERNTVYKTHLDWHFNTNMKLKGDTTTKSRMRGWYREAVDWIQHEEVRNYFNTTVEWRICCFLRSRVKLDFFN